MIFQTRTGAALVCAFTILVPAHAGPFDVKLVLDGRLVSTPRQRSFFDRSGSSEGGLGKTRYGGQRREFEAKLAQAAGLVRFEPFTTLEVQAQVNVDAERDLGRRVDIVEAVVRFRPALSDRVTLDTRAGLFFPTLSLENTDDGWLSPYSTSFSAINSWIGEEVRSLGLEAGPRIRIGDSSVKIFGSVTRQNDPSGTLLSWRGFALHDRVSAFGDRIPLPALRSFARPDLFPGQAPFVEPMREVDGRWSWSAGLAATTPTLRVRGLYQPETADKTVFDGEQYAWRTGFWSAGFAATLGPTEVIAQGLLGRTRMGKTPQGVAAVENRFGAGFLLISAAAGRHRWTARADAFDVRDDDRFRREDPNREVGSAWTFAYVLTLNGRARLFAEVLTVRSERANRLDIGERPRQRETLASLSLRLAL